MSERIVPRVNPRVLRTPTSRTRSRTDIAIVFADTRRIVKVTAAQMLIRIIFTLPRNATKLSANARSDSVLVCDGEL